MTFWLLINFGEDGNRFQKRNTNLLFVDLWNAWLNEQQQQQYEIMRGQTMFQLRRYCVEPMVSVLWFFLFPSPIPFLYHIIVCRNVQIPSPKIFEWSHQKPNENRVLASSRNGTKLGGGSQSILNTRLCNTWLLD